MPRSFINSIGSSIPVTGSMRPTGCYGFGVDVKPDLGGCASANLTTSLQRAAVAERKGPL